MNDDLRQCKERIKSLKKQIEAIKELGELANLLEDSVDNDLNDHLASSSNSLDILEKQLASETRYRDGLIEIDSLQKKGKFFKAMLRSARLAWDVRK